MEILTAVLYVICTAIRLIVGFLQAAMFIRAILSWFMPDEEHILMRLLWIRRTSPMNPRSLRTRTNTLMPTRTKNATPARRVS